MEEAIRVAQNEPRRFMVHVLIYGPFGISDRARWSSRRDIKEIVSKHLVVGPLEVSVLHINAEGEEIVVHVHGIVEETDVAQPVHIRLLSEDIFKEMMKYKPSEVVRISIFTFPRHLGEGFEWVSLFMGAKM